MSFGARFRNWRRTKRRAKAAHQRRNMPLREFAYLDDVSVYSLIASRLGPIATDFTDKETASLQSELSGSLEADALVAKGQLKSRLQANQGSESQVVRKSLVQSTFRDLYDFEFDTLALRPTDPTALPPIRTKEELRSAAERTTDSDNWIVRPDALQRGQLVELEVELEAEPIFRLNTVVATVLEIMRENTELFGITEFDDFIQIDAIQRVLDKLLVGLIPVRGRSVDFDVVTMNAQQYLVHRKVLDRLPDNEQLERRPLYLVAVTEEARYWRDIRRVLFSGDSYRVLARISRNGVHDTWTPVKLADVLRDVSPDLGTQLDALGHSAFDKATGISAHATRTLSAQEQFSTVATRYAVAIADHHGALLDQAALRQAGVMDLRSPALPSTVPMWRTELEPVVRHLEKRLGISTDPAVLSEIRMNVLTQAGHGLIKPSSQVLPAAEPPANERFLHAEMVAIYW